GSAVAKIIGNNVKKLQKFASTVKMWVFEENIDGRKLTDIINNDHENVKYLPGYKLPDNVVAIPNLNEAVQDADLLVFVIPHQYIHKVCDEITGRVPRKALGITLIKGIDEGPEGLKLISDIIREKMGIDISVLMGANIASEVAAEKFCETTIGCKILENGLLFKELLQTPNFRITVVDDADTVELCGALK
ncbi:GPD1L protein, partial [Vireo altiloquus]|nr:GPD1L protein [Vireo altiloquus]